MLHPKGAVIQPNTEKPSSMRLTQV